MSITDVILMVHILGKAVGAIPFLLGAALVAYLLGEARVARSLVFTAGMIVLFAGGIVLAFVWGVLALTRDDDEDDRRCPFR